MDPTKQWHVPHVRLTFDTFLSDFFSYPFLSVHSCSDRRHQPRSYHPFLSWILSVESWYTFQMLIGRGIIDCFRWPFSRNLCSHCLSCISGRASIMQSLSGPQNLSVVSFWIGHTADRNKRKKVVHEIRHCHCDRHWLTKQRFLVTWHQGGHSSGRPKQRT